MEETTFRLYSFIAQCSQALFTFLVAIIGAYIAYLQFRLARDKRRHELYERRLLVFRATTEFLHHLRNDVAMTDDRLTEFVIHTAEAEFLFQEDVTGFIKSLTALGFRQIADEDDNPHGITDEYFFRYSEDIRLKFTPYLNLQET